MAPLPPTRDRPVTPHVRHDLPAALPSDLAGDPGGMPPGKPSRGRRILRTIGLVLIILFAVVLGAFAAVAFVAKKQVDDFVTPKTAAEKEAAKQLNAPLPGKPANILVLGSDYRASNSADGKRSDTMLLVRLDPKGETISMLSIPRDLYVTIPGHGEAKINDAFSLGGPALSVETVKELTGLDVNFVMNVDFKGFRGVVDALGGIWVDVDREYFNKHDGTEATNYAEIDIDPGYQLLNGRKALAYARFRHDQHSDFARIARQQQTLAALKKQVGSEFKVSQVPGLVRVLNENVSLVAGGGDKGVPTKVIIDYMRLAMTLEGRDVYEIEVTGETGETESGASVVFANEAIIKGAVDAFLEPSADAREKTADQVTGQTSAPAETPVDPADAAPDPADVSVTVLNGGGVDGAAGGMTEQLRSIGYQVVLPDQAQAAEFPNLANTVVEYRAPASKAAAEALAARIEGASAAMTNSENSFDTKLLVVVGKVGTTAEGAGIDPGAVGGDAPTTEYEANVVPEKREADVLTDPEYGRTDFEAMRAPGFPVLYPTVREETSSYEEPRSYKVRKGEKGRYGAYRIVALTSEGHYWGLQGTDWPDPPILDSPTRELEKGTRTYKLYFTGTKLHMVAWREGNGTYWVSNSVLNALSNETMLAIAEGAKPL